MTQSPEHEREPILDEGVIDGLRALDEPGEDGLLAELVGLFLQDAPTHVREIVEGIESGDLEQVRRASHTLKSSSANMGAASLSSLACSIESSARAGEGDLLRNLSGALGGVYRRTADALGEVS